MLYQPDSDDDPEHGGTVTVASDQPEEVAEHSESQDLRVVQ